MFKTIKSKITLISVSMLMILGIVLALFVYIYLKNSASLVIQSYYYNIAVFAQDINKEVMKIEANAKELSLIGEGFEEKREDKEKLGSAIIKVFEAYKNTLGGGVWFKPYYIDSNKRLFCVYAFRNKEDKVVTDNEFETEQYNYPNQKWYREIKDGIKTRNDLVWSTPYYEKEGSKTVMITAGSGIFKEGEVVGFSTADWDITTIIETIKNMRPTENSFALFADVKNDAVIVVTDPNLEGLDLLGKSLKNIPWYNTNLKNITYMDYDGKTYVPYVKMLDNGMVYIVCIPVDELFNFILTHTVILFVVLMLVSIVISTVLYMVLKKSIQKPIDKLITIANKISSGKLDEQFEIKEPEEFSKLASTFDKMTKDIREITKERARISSELSIARKIQYSSLPDVFPPYPDRFEFDIYASMEAAKEVGGDFYDFYFLDENRLMFIVADVSGKGIPAALFMMITKSLITGMAQTYDTPERIALETNIKLFNNNKEKYFVTALIGVLNIKTGELEFVNCGHNMPLIKRNGQEAEYIQLESNIILGLFNVPKFEVYKTKLNKDDLIVMYTDGVTEAMNEKEELYGEARLKDSLNNANEKDVKNVVDRIKKDTFDFMDNSPQSDDITLLALKYNGELETVKYSCIAEVKNYSALLKVLYDFCGKQNLDVKTTQKLELMVEEIFANISSYAYGVEKGNIQIEISKAGSKIIVKFEDDGIKYNPLEKEDPDINIPVEKRKIGGLGIFMVKNTADDIKYEYKEKKNILTLTLNI